MPNLFAEALNRIAEQEDNDTRAAGFRSLSVAYAADQQRILDLLTAHVGNSIFWVYALVQHEDIENDPEVRDLVMTTLRKLNDAIDQLPRHMMTRQSLRLNIFIGLASLLGIVTLALLFVVTLWR